MYRVIKVIVVGALVMVSMLSQVNVSYAEDSASLAFVASDAAGGGITSADNEDGDSASTPSYTGEQSYTTEDDVIDADEEATNSTSGSNADVTSTQSGEATTGLQADEIAIPDEIEHSVGLLQGVMPLAINCSTATSVFNGAGTQANPYLISSADDLAKFSCVITAGNSIYRSGKYYLLDSDIDLSAYDPSAPWADSSGVQRTGGWMPIGTAQNRFSGNFNGGGHVISGMKIDRTNTLNVDPQGLFGAVATATISNLGIVNSSINSTYFVGGLIGDANNSTTTITNCYNSGSVTGDYRVGGLVGFVNAGISSFNTITNSYNTGTIIGNSQVGGLVGYASAGNSTVNITNSYNVGNVTGNSQVGGLVGYANIYSGKATPKFNIQNNLSIAKVVAGNSEVGRIWGVNATAGTITASNNYALIRMTDGSSICGTATGRDITNIGNSFDGSDNDTGATNNRNGKSLSYSEVNTVDEFKSKAGLTNWNATDVWLLEDNKLPILKSTAVSHPVISGQDSTLPAHLLSPQGIISPFGGGDGSSAANAYEISTPKQLAQMACLVNESKEDFSIGKYYKLTVDIDLADYGTYKIGSNSIIEQNWISIYGDQDAAKNATGASLADANSGGWVPIGTYISINDSSKSFSGYFDGGGHTISNLKINRVASFPNSDNLGLFGFITGGSIGSLGIINVDINGNNAVGGLVARVNSYNNSVFALSSSYVSGLVKGSGDITGGLIGYMKTETSDNLITVTNSYNLASVEGNLFVGGIVGKADATGSLTDTISITSSYNAGIIKGSERTGGIVGRAYSEASANINIINTYNSGYISGQNVGTGGIAGRAYAAGNSSAVSVINSYNIGIVEAVSVVGGLLGNVEATSSTSSSVKIINSLSLGRVVNGNLDVGRIWGRHVSGNIVASNNYALATINDGSDYTCGILVNKTIAIAGNKFDGVAGDTGSLTNKNGFSIAWSGTTPYLSSWTNENNNFWTAAGNWNTNSPDTVYDSSVWNFVQNKIPTLKNMPTPDLQNNLPATHITSPSNITSPFGGGDGSSAENAYEISTPKQLAQMACLVNGNQTAFRIGKFWKLTADIDLLDWGTYQFGVPSPSKTNWESIYGADTFSSGSNYTNLTGGSAKIVGVSDQDADHGGWVPIGICVYEISNCGTASYPFIGNFDGDGHIISNLRINREVNYQGLFAYVDSDDTNATTISNFGIMHSSIKSSGASGMIVASLISEGTQPVSISNVFNTGSIEGYANSTCLSGIVGCISVRDANVSITNSYNTGSISGSNMVAGIVGQSSNPRTSNIKNITYSNCYNTGIIKSVGIAGGIIGNIYTLNSTNNITINNSLSLGSSIKGSGGAGSVGRIWGSDSSIIQGYNNYASQNMKVSTDGSDPVNVVGNEGNEPQTLGKKNGYGSSINTLLSSTFYSTESNWKDLSANSGIQTGWNSGNNDTWYKQDNWIPVLRGFGVTTNSIRYPYNFTGSFNNDFIGPQDGNLNTSSSASVITYQPGLGLGTPLTQTTDDTGILSTTTKMFNETGFSAPSSPDGGGTFSYWCISTPTGTPANICPESDRVDQGYAGYQFLANTTLTAVYKMNAKVDFSSLVFADREYNGTTDINSPTGNLSLQNNYAMVDISTLSCTYMLESKNVNATQNIKATCNIVSNSEDDGRFTIQDARDKVIGTVSITAKDITLEEIESYAKEYDGTNTASIGMDEGILLGKIDGDTLDFNDCQGMFTDKNAGNNKEVIISNCTLLGADSINYRLIQPSNVTADITPKSLEVSIDDWIAVVGESLNNSSIPASRLSISGLIPGDSVVGNAIFNTTNPSCNTLIELTIDDCIILDPNYDIVDSSNTSVKDSYDISITTGRLVVYQDTVTSTPADPATGVIISDPNGQLPGNACVSIYELALDSAAFTSLDAEITDSNVLQKAWDIKLVDCNTGSTIDLNYEVEVKIPNAGLKDAPDAFKLWHKHFGGINHDQPEQVAEHYIKNYSRSDDALIFTTNKLSYFGISYPSPSTSIASTGLNFSRVLVLLLLVAFLSIYRCPRIRKH